MGSLRFLRYVNSPRIMSRYYEDNFRLFQHVTTRSASTASLSLSNEKVGPRKIFNDTLPELMENLMTTPQSKISHLPEVANWMRKVLDHNLHGGKQSRGLITMTVYEMFEKPENLTEENLKLSRILGWCTEMVNSFFCATDDIIDGSSTRHNQPCWYLMPEAGMGAVNDAVLMLYCVPETLNMYFGKSPHLSYLSDLVNEAIIYTCMGQYIDSTRTHCSKFTMQRFKDIALYKTSYYSFRLPVLLGMHLVKNIDPKIYPAIDEITFLLGELYQIQNDYLDCYVDASLTGKIGTDIDEGKCTWLAVTALELCNQQQKELFTKYYGSRNPEHVAQIKNLYRDLCIPELYFEKELEMHNDIKRRARELPLEGATQFFYKVSDKIHKRKR